MKKHLFGLFGIIIVLSSLLTSCEDLPVFGDAESCNVSVEAMGGGNVCIDGFSTSSISIEYGSEITVVATPINGTLVLGWYIGNISVCTDLRYTFTVNGNTSLAARFDKVNDKTNITPEIYERDLTEDEVSNAISVLSNGMYLQTIPSGTYCLRGGKIQDGVVYKPSSHAYQRLYSYGPDLYAQYFTIPHKDFMYGTQTSTYDISADFNGGPLKAYTMAKSVFIPILNQPEINNIPEIKAITLLYYCLSAQEHADLSGPFSYIEDRLNIETPTQYNNLGTIYHDIVKSLDNIVACLKYYEENRPDWYKSEIRNILSEFDLTRSWDTGDYSMNPYIKLANSLKLRMAMHIVKVQPETAQEWAEEAVASGVIENTGEQMGFFQSYDAIGHPLVQIQSWGDIRLSASFESLLMSLNHPYTKTLFKPNNNKIVNRNDNTVLEANTRICGIRSGVYVGTGQDYSQNQYQAYSTFDTDMMTEAPLYFIKWSEVDFLRAEGKLRGWDMGEESAQFFYERGIKNADLLEPIIAEMEFFGTPYSKYVDDYYMAQTEATPYTNIDPIGDGEPWESVTKIGVAWNVGDDNETMLEKIITQKYIALFPLSTEAWAELRRTGYPKLFPVLNPEDGDGSIKEGGMIRRIPWVPTDPAAKEMVSKSGTPALGGADKQATRLWWDVDAPNF